MVVFTHQLDVGGGQLFLQEILRGLLADPGSSVVVVSAKDGVLRTELEALGADVYVVEYPVESVKAYEERVHLLELVVRSHEAQVVLVNTMSAGMGADVACRLGLPVAWAIHESYALSDFWTTAYGKEGTAPQVRGCIERALSAVPAVLFEANATQALFAEAVPPNRPATLRYGVWVDAITQFRAGHDRTQVRTALGLDERATVVLCMGTFEPRKAQGALIVAFAEVARSHQDVTLVLVGDTGTDYAIGVRGVAERLQLGERIRLVPVVEDHFPGTRLQTSSSSRPTWSRCPARCWRPWPSSSRLPRPRFGGCPKW